jgi:hypothetical protein
MGESAGTSSKVAFEWLLSRVDSHVANELVLLAEFLAAPGKRWNMK